jgi:dipeptidase
MIVRAGAPPRPYTLGNPAKLQRDSAYWAHKYVQNLAQLRYERMIVDIAANAARWERRAMALVATMRDGGLGASAARTRARTRVPHTHAAPPGPS